MSTCRTLALDLSDQHGTCSPRSHLGPVAKTARGAVCHAAFALILCAVGGEWDAPQGCLLTACLLCLWPPQVHRRGSRSAEFDVPQSPHPLLLHLPRTTGGKGEGRLFLSSLLGLGRLNSQGQQPHFQSVPALPKGVRMGRGHREKGFLGSTMWTMTHQQQARKSQENPKGRKAIGCSLSRTDFPSAS